jgi:hypothetical protein
MECSLSLEKEGFQGKGNPVKEIILSACPLRVLSFQTPSASTSLCADASVCVFKTPSSIASLAHSYTNCVCVCVCFSVYYFVLYPG